MKLKCQFVINNVAGECIAVPVGKNSDFHGYIKLNETGKDVFELLKKDTDRAKIISALAAKYPEATAAEIEESVDNVINKLKAADMLI
ncbi:MAG: PqqD family protein [Clostridia bacterium]|nr:PqqD family protein [Clostridia bacterium]